MTISTVVAHDHRLVRRGLCLVLERIRGVSIVAEAATGRETLYLASRHDPDLVVASTGIRRPNAFDVAAKLARTRARVLLVTSLPLDVQAEVASRAGVVAGYVFDDCAESEFARAVRAAAAGKRVLGKRQRLSIADRLPYDHLTERQREVFDLVAQGRTNREIARILKVAVKTVESHRASVMQALSELGIHNVAGLVNFAARAGLTRSK